jgi:hypothetical protein
VTKLFLVLNKNEQKLDNESLHEKTISMYLNKERDAQRDTQANTRCELRNATREGDLSHPVSKTALREMALRRI